MRRDKTFTRILLIFSIANVVLAAPAVMRQRRLVTDRSGDESTDKSTPLLNDLIDSYSASQSSAASGSVAQASPPSSAESWHQDSAMASVAPQSNDPQPWSETSESHYAAPAYVPPFTSGNRDPPSQHDPPPETEMQPLFGNQPQASEAAQLHDDKLPASGAQPIFEDSHPSWHDFRPGTEIEEVAEPDVHDVPDVHKDQGDDYHYFDFDDYIKSNSDNDNDEVKPKGLCGLRVHCWDWDFSEVFSEFKDFTHWRRTRSFE
jgi:hypothetical protein